MTGASIWNTVYLEWVVQTLRDSRKDVNDSLLPHLSPLGWEHINLTGDYIWRQSKQFEQSKFRPVCSRTQHVLAVENILARELGASLPSNAIKRLTAEQVDRLGLSADVALAIKSNVAVIATLEQEIGRLESRLLEG